MPTLRELEATFLKHIDAISHRSIGEKREGADGIMFLCPLCFVANKGPVGTHSVICWFTGVPLTVCPGPGRWNPSGTSIDDLTFVGPGAVSVQLRGGCNWHGFVKDGKAE